MRAFIKRNLPAVITTVSTLVIVALVAVIALVSTGYTEQKLTLGDASVWVTNGSQSVVGRANTEIFALNTVVETESSDIDVLQHEQTVISRDRANNTIALINPATSTVESSVLLPADSPALYLSDEALVIHQYTTGSVWVVRFDAIEDFDPSRDPDFELGEGSAVALSKGGDFVGYNREKNTVVSSNITLDTEPQKVTLSGFSTEDDDDVQVTVVKQRIVVVNTTSKLAWTAAGTLALEDVLGDAEEILVQEGADSGARALISWESGMLAISTDEGVATVVTDEVNGKPARPVAAAGCDFAAWADGTSWQQCGNGSPEIQALPSMSADTELAFRSNGDYVVLNERAGGKVWAVQSGGRLIDNWEQLIKEDTIIEQIEDKNEDTPPELDKEAKPPVALNDDFGARAGRANPLPILLNDYDPNGDIVVVSSHTDIAPELGVVEVINNNQALQVTLTDAASGSFTFDYTISDGKGGEAAATVTVTVRADGENSPPVQARSTNHSVALGGQFTANVLKDWYDPDGDPMFLETAGTAEPSRVSFEPTGEITFQHRANETGTAEVSLTVSDFTAAGGGTVGISVGAPGTVPVIAEGFALQGYTGQSIDLEPLEFVRGGTGEIKLTNVAEINGATITPNYPKNSFQFTTGAAGVYYVTYSVADSAQQTASGQVRIDIVVAPDASTKPVTVPTVAFLYQQQTEIIDVLASDYDPAGGVLSIESVDQVNPATGAIIEVLDHRVLRVRLNNVMTEPLKFGYTVTNGLTSARGQVTVFQIPEPPRLQAPVATYDSVSARVGEVIEIPVLENDVHPNSKSLALDPTLVQGLGAGEGLLFASGNSLRYLAPKTPGTYTAIYKLTTAADIQFDTAEVTITVREADKATNTAPAPKNIETRVIAGETVKIPVPLTGVDADGDTVRLIGAKSNPDKGNVTLDTNAFVYTAGEKSRGTDTFSYEVVDSLGAKATATVRIGVTGSLSVASTPIAMDDVVVAEPGTKLTARVLDNDSDPNGSPLKVVSVESTDESLKVKAKADGVALNIPNAEGDFAAIYTIENAQGQQASGWLRLRVTNDAPPIRPEASDSVLTLTDVDGKETVDVDVLANVFFAETSSPGLSVTTVDGYNGNAVAIAGDKIQVTVTNRSQIIPFEVARKDLPEISSRAFIWVPGLQDAVPELRTNTKPLEVISGETLKINVNDYVVAAGNKTVKITDREGVKASNSNGAPLAPSDTTIEFTSTPEYAGPASVSFEVTDGESANDTAARTAVIVLAITVKPRANTPPEFQGADIQLEPGNERTIDLKDLTKYPYADAMNQLVYSLGGGLDDSLGAKLEGSKLTLSAKGNAKVGAVGQLPVSVRDSTSDGKTGTVQVTVVTSNRPLASPGSDSIEIKRGESKTVDVLANDRATNPFPENPLKVVSVRGGAAGVTVSPSGDMNQITVSVAASYNLQAGGVVSLQYEVQDGTGDSARNTWGTVTVTVVDVPDAPNPPVQSVSGFVPNQITVTADPLPYPNGRPITSFQIRSTTGYVKNCGTSATCVLNDVPVGVDMVFYAVAVNSIGESLPSGMSTPMRADNIPAAPSSVSAAVVAANSAQSNPGLVDFTWPAIKDPNPGSAIEAVYISVNGGAPIQLDKAATTYRHPGTAGNQYAAVVWAQNGAQKAAPGVAISWSTASSNSITAAGAPTAGTATASYSAGVMKVTHAGQGQNGGPSLSIRVQRTTTAGAPACSTGVTNGSPSSGTYTDSGVAPYARVAYWVFVDNGWGCTSLTSNFARALVPPGPPTNFTLGLQAADQGIYKAKLTGLNPPAGAPSDVTFEFENGDAAPAVGDLMPGGDFNTLSEWKIRACVSDPDTGARVCGEPAPKSIEQVNAKLAPMGCFANMATLSPSMAQGSDAGWTFEFRFRAPAIPGTPATATSPAVPGTPAIDETNNTGIAPDGARTVTIKTTKAGHGGISTFTNGQSHSASAEPTAVRCP